MNEVKSNENEFMSTFNGFESYVDQISDTLKAPVTLEDAHHHLLGYSNHENVKDPVRISTIIGRQVPEKVINGLWKEGIIPELMASDKPIRIKRMEEINLNNRVAISIRNYNDVIGYIWVIEENDELKEDALIFLAKAAKAMRVPLVQYYSSKSKREGSYQDFFWQLLLGNIKSEDEIVKKLNHMNISSSRLFTVMVFRFDEELVSEFNKQIIYFLYTTQQVQVIFHVFDGKDLILLVSTQLKDSPSQSFHRFIQSFVSQMSERLKIHDVEAVYGGIYGEFIKVEASYKEALTVLDIKEKLPKETQSLYSYNNLGIYQLINTIHSIRKKEKYENTSLKKIKEYDCLHNQSFLETLETYLDNDSNTYEAAKALHIHTNTLNYRLKRIGEISDLDLKDFSQKMSIYLDLKIEKLI